MAKKNLIAVPAPLDLAYCREAVKGIRRFAEAMGHWRIRVLLPRRENLRWVWRDSEFIGMIGMLASFPEPLLPDELPVPAVNISSRSSPDPWFSVVTDNYAIGRAAAEHFLDRGFRSIAYVGVNRFHFSEVRRQGLCAGAAAAGVEVVDLGGNPPRARDLLRLPRPTALLAANDVRAMRLLMACENAGLRVPEDMAVLGVDNDETICEVADVALSSIDPSAGAVGFQAAQALADILDGREPAERVRRVPPAGVVTRMSTDVVAVPEPDLAVAVRYIQDHACDPMTVEQMMEEISVSRRTLEKRFQATFGRTLHAEIRRQQFQRARRLLAESDLVVPEVASRCGFSDPKRFTNLFSKAHGMPPTKYRHQFRHR